MDQITNNVDILLLFTLRTVMFEYKLLCILPQLVTKLFVVNQHLAFINKFLPQHDMDPYIRDEVT